MMLLILIACATLYVTIAVEVTRMVWRKTQNKLKRNMVLLFFILLPIWDVLLGCMVYYPMCWFWAGKKVYRTVENIDTVYYDTYARDAGITNYTKFDYFRKGIKFVEMDVKKLAPASIAKTTGLYRFSIDNNNTVFAQKISKPSSQIVIAEHMKEIYIPHLIFNTYTVYNSVNKEVMAYSNDVSLKYISIFGVPFLSWLNWTKHFVKYKSCMTHRDNIVDYVVK